MKIDDKLCLQLMSKNILLTNWFPKGYSIGELEHWGRPVGGREDKELGLKGGKIRMHRQRETYQKILTCMYFNDLAYQIRLHLLF